MNLKEKRAAAIKAAQEIIEKAQAEKRDLTDAEMGTVEAKRSEIEELTGLIERAEKSASLVASIVSVKEREPLEEPPAELGGKSAPSGIGERFVKSAAFQDFRKSHPSGVGSGTPIRVEAKGIGSLADLGVGKKATITTGTGQFVSQGRESGYRDYLPNDEALTFLDLITTGNTEFAYSEYAQVIAETNNAAVVAEGELKPLSDITTRTQESKAYTYADGFDVTNQTLADDGALVAFMESRIRRHVLGVVEQKLFNGTGTGTEPLGITKTTGTLAQAFDVDVVTTLARALEKFESNNGDSEAQAIVMRSSDVWALRLLKDSEGRYLLGNPLQQGPIPTPWGVPIVRSNKLAAGTALVGRFDSVNFLQLEALNVLAFNQHKDYAQRNMAYVRAEMRGRQLFYAPREVVVTSLTA